MSLSRVLLSNLTNPDLEIELNVDEITFLKEILNETPEVFDNIVDEKMDIHDIPQIIASISMVYNSILIEKVDMINIIRFTINSILDSHLFLSPDIELSIIMKVVDGSIDLLKMNMILSKKDEEVWCYSLFCPPKR